MRDTKLFNLLCEFQSALPRMGGDTPTRTSCPSASHFTPCLVQGRGLRAAVMDFLRTDISTHASRTGGDERGADIYLLANSFQPTPPTREATIRGNQTRRWPRYFNPRLPHGRRLNIAR